MIAAIADTHTAIWYVYGDLRLGEAARVFIETTITNGARIGISAISLAEMVYLTEKERIPADALDDILTAIADAQNVLQHIPLDDQIAVAMRGISRQEVADLPDRIIAATANFYGVPVLSRDRRIRAANIATIW